MPVALIFISESIWVPGLEIQNLGLSLNGERMGLWTKDTMCAAAIVSYETPQGKQLSDKWLVSLLFLTLEKHNRIWHLQAAHTTKCIIWFLNLIIKYTLHTIDCMRATVFGVNVS